MNVSRARALSAYTASIGTIGLALAVLAGVFLRFDNLGGKVVYQDEAVTQLHASGHFDHADLRVLFDGTIRPASAIGRLTHWDPDRGLSATVAAVAKEDSDQGVLFYVLERGFIAVFGSSIAAYRLVAVIFGILTIWASWLLARELFQSKGIAGVYAAVVALSPFEILYAHEARAYTMAAFFMLASSYVLVRALRTANLRDWIAYAALLALGLYTSMLLFLVFAAHAGYVILGFRKVSGAVVRFCASGVLAILAFVPWLYELFSNHNLVSAELTWGSTAYGLRAMAEKWLFNAGAQFFDLEWIGLKYAVVAALCLLLAAYSIVYLVTHARATQWSLVIFLGGVTAAVFVGRDLVEHAHWSTTARYLLPTWLALQLSVAYMLGSWIFGESGSRAARFGTVLLSALLVCEAVSGSIGTRSESWYDDELSASTPHIAARINGAQRPTLLISEKGWGFQLDLSNYLDPDVRLELFADARKARIRTDGYAEVLTTTPTPALAAAFNRDGYALKRVYLYQSRSSAYSAFHRERSGPAERVDNSSPSFPNGLYQVVKH